MKNWKNTGLFALALALVLLLSGCAAPTNADAGFVLTDDLGREVRVASLERVAVPQSSFADLWQLAGGTVSATSQDTLEEGVPQLPEGTADLGSLKNPSVEAILSQNISFCILSANIAGHVELQDTLESAGIPTAYFDVETFEDYLRVLKIMTNLTGQTALYQQNGEDIKARVDAAIARKEGHPAPTVLLLRAFSTGVKAKGSDNMTGAMLKDLGCENIADSENSLLEDLSMEVILAKDPDFIFMVPMGQEDAAAQTMAETLQANPAWAGLSAVQNGRYIVLPKELFHLKPNNRWGEAYEMLADILYAA